MIDKKCIRIVEQLYVKKLKEIKPEALVLCESFIFDEDIVQSAIGNVNEKPYENLYKMAKTYG